MPPARPDPWPSSPRRAPPAHPAWWLALGVVVLAPWLDAQPAWPALFGALCAALGAALGLAALAPDGLAPGPMRGGRRDPARALAVCVAGLIGLAALQTLPLGAALGRVSPATVAARAPFAAEPAAPGPEGPGLEGPTCLSLAPHLTRAGALTWAGAAVIALLAARAGPPRALCAVLLAGGAAQALAALAHVGALPRARGTFVSSNNLALLLALLLPVALALGGVGQRAPPRGAARGLPLAAAALLALALVATRSRSGLLAAVTGALVFAWLVGLARGRRGPWLLGGGLALALALGADLTLGRFERLFAGEETDRLAFWAIAWGIFTRFPLLGAGLRSHAALTPEHHPGPRLLEAAHNDYLNLLADCGLAGLALAAVGAVAWGRCVARGLAGLPAGGARRALLAACAAAVAGAAAASVVDFGLQVAAVLWTCAALAGVAAGGDPEARPRARPSGWTRALGLGLGLAALCLAFQGARLGLARRALDRAQAAATPAEDRWRAFARAARLWPEQARVDLAWGRALRAAGDEAGARRAFARAVRKDPRAPWAHLERAQVEPGLAAAARQRARTLAPRDPAVRLEAGRQALAAAGAAHGAGPAARRDARAEGLADLREAVAQDPARLPDALAVVLALPDVAAADCEAVVAGGPPDLRRRCVIALAGHSPGPARLLLEPLLGPGAAASDLAAAGELEARLGRLDLACAAWLAAAREHPDPGGLLEGGADALERAGRRDLAGDLLARAAEVRPDDARVWRALGRHHLRARRPVEARAALERAVARDPAVGGAELGQAFLAEGRLDSALLAWRRAAGAATTRAERADLHVRMARALAARDDRTGAREAARAALALDPGHAGARALLDELAPPP